MLITDTLQKIRRYGLSGSTNRLLGRVRRKTGFDTWRCRNAPVYANPTELELLHIEQALKKLDIMVHDYSPPVEGFSEFLAAGYFPADYHGGTQSGVWDEKLLEHWLAAERLKLFTYGKGDIYVDVAACGSPWAKILRARHEIQTYAIDLVVKPEFLTLDFYREENATKTSFLDSSVRGMSLQCAFEMFLGSDDVDFVSEIRRILRPGGKVVILPLYMHTTYCTYSTPDFFGKGYGDPNAAEYVRFDAWGIPSSRKYDAATLKQRLLSPIERAGLEYDIYALRNKRELGEGIYCHFILEIIKPE
jgi:ubiquinone/menaquinone biosynthesis C-methylase UbiE